jgi:hypothetical protein
VIDDLGRPRPGKGAPPLAAARRLTRGTPEERAEVGLVSTFMQSGLEFMFLMHSVNPFSEPITFNF